MNLTKNNKILIVGVAVAAGSMIDSNSSRINMAGFDSVTFIAPIADSVATGVATLKIEQNDADSDTGMTAIEGATATATCSVNDDLNGKALVVEVFRPTKRYVQAVLTSATANIAYDARVAILSEPRTLPVAESTTIADMTLVTN